MNFKLFTYFFTNSHFTTTLFNLYIVYQGLLTAALYKGLSLFTFLHPQVTSRFNIKWKKIWYWCKGILISMRIGHFTSANIFNVISHHETEEVNLQKKKKKKINHSNSDVYVLVFMQWLGVQNRFILLIVRNLMHCSELSLKSH